MTSTSDQAAITRPIESAARGRLDHRRLVAVGATKQPRHRYPDRGALRRMLGRVTAARAEALWSPAVDEGIDVRFETDRVAGSALLRDERVVHLEVHRVDR